MTTPEPNPTPAPISATDTVVTAIAGQLGPDVGITSEQISLVLGAWNDVQQGAPLGTILRNPETGAIAHRVCQEGRNLWRVSLANGERWDDLNPTLAGWETLVDPTV